MADREPKRRGEGGKRNTTIEKMTSRVLEISSISVSKQHDERKEMSGGFRYVAFSFTIVEDR